MWATQAEFNQAVLAVADKYQALERTFSWLKSFDVTKAFALYTNAARSRFNFLVCGRTRINQDRNRVEGSSIEEVDLFNLGATHHSPVNQDVRASYSGTGSVLHYRSGWHFLLNDAWLLGGVHSESEFHLASPRHRNNIVDPKGNVLTVTGRELTGLNEFGYKFQKVGYMNQQIAVCAVSSKARTADFSLYWAAIERQGNGSSVDPILIDPEADLISPNASEVAAWGQTVPFGPQLPTR